MKCEYCDKPAEYGGLCFTHAKIEDWRDNSDINDMGIVRFAHDIFPDRFDSSYGTPPFHREMLADLLIARATGKNKYDRMHLFAAPREHSKSTIASFLFVLYCIAYGLIRFAVISSDSDPKAQQFLRAIRSSLNSPRFIQFFGRLNPMSVEHSLDKDANKWSQNHIVTASGIHIVTMGMGQSARGLLEDIGRPDLVIADDIESETNTKTAEARAKNWDWWRKQMVPACDVINGQVIYIGTMLHEDCTLGKLLHHENFYKKHFYQVVTEPKNPEDRKKPLWEWDPLWPEKFTPELIKAIYMDFISDEQRGIDQFYCEYMNISVAPQNRRFGPSSIVERDFEFWIDAYGRKWIRYEGEVRYVETFLGVDLAISESDRAAWTVIMAMAVTHSGLRFILDYRRGRYDVRNDEDSGREGTIDNVVEMIREYWPVKIGFETSGIGLPIYRELRREIRGIERRDENFRVPMIQPLTQTSDKDKDTRIVAILVSPHKQRKIIQRPSHTELKNEQQGFPKTAWKDCLDAEANAYVVSHPPSIDVPYGPQHEILYGTNIEEQDTFEELDWQMP